MEAWIRPILVEPFIVPVGLARLTCQLEQGVEARNSKDVGLVGLTRGRNLRVQGQRLI